MSNKRQDYFVRRMDADSYRPLPEAMFEIQILDADGCGAQCAYLDGDSDKILCAVNFVTPPSPTIIDPATQYIPKPVIEAARKRIVGFGERVNERGEILPPF